MPPNARERSDMGHMDFSGIGTAATQAVLVIVGLTVAATLGGVWLWNHVSISIGVN